MEIIIVVLIILIIFLSVNLFIQKMAVRGLIFYIGKTYGEDRMPSADKLTEMTTYAANRTIKEFFGN